MSKHKKSRPPKTKTAGDTRMMALRDLFEAAQLTPLVKNSYVLSRFWAWCSRIELSPRVRIPVPRAFSYRDP